MVCRGIMRWLARLLLQSDLDVKQTRAESQCYYTFRDLLYRNHDRRYAVVLYMGHHIVFMIGDVACLAATIACRYQDFGR